MALSLGKVFNIQGVINVLSRKAEAELQNFVSEAEDAADETDSAFKRIGVSAVRLAGPAAIGAIGFALAKIGEQALELGVEMQSAMKMFQVETGASAAEAQRFSDVIDSLYRNNTESVDQLSAAVTQVTREFGDLGDQTESTTQSFLDFSKVTGQDGAGAVKLVSNLLRAYNLELQDASGVMDLLTKASQLSGASVERIGQAMSTTVPVTQTLGLSIEETAAVFALLEKNAVGVEAANEGLRTLATASASATENQTRAFRGLGIAVDELGRPIGGARAAFDQLLNILESGIPQGERFNHMLTLLGSETGTKLMRGLEGGTQAFEEFKSKVEDSAGSVSLASQIFDEQFSQKIQKIYRQDIAPTVQELAKGFQWLIENLIVGLDKAIDWLIDFATVAGQVSVTVMPAWEKMTQGIEAMWDAMADRIIDIYVAMVDLILEGIRTMPNITRKYFDEAEKMWTQYRTRLQRKRSGNPMSGQEGFNNFADGLEEMLTKGYAGFKEGLANRPDRSRTDEPAPPETSTSTQAKLSAVPELRNETDRLTLINREVEALNRKVELEKIAKSEAIALYSVLISKAKEAGASEKELHEIKKRQFAVQKQIDADAEKSKKEKKRENEAAKKEAEKKLKELQKIHVETIRSTEGETAAALQALEDQRKAYLKAGQDKLDVEKWYQAQKTKIQEEQQKLDKQIHQQTLQAQEKEKEAQIEALKQQVEEFRKQGADKSKLAAFQKAGLAKIEKDHQEKLDKAEDDIETKTLLSLGKKKEATKKAALDRLEEEVKAYRKAGVEETKIAAFVAAEKRRITKSLQDEKKAPTSPVYGLDRLTGGSALPSFGSSLGELSSLDISSVFDLPVSSKLGVSKPSGSRPSSVFSKKPDPDQAKKHESKVLVVIEVKNAEGEGSKTADPGQSLQEMQFRVKPGGVS